MSSIFEGVAIDNSQSYLMELKSEKESGLKRLKTLPIVPNGIEIKF